MYSRAKFALFYGEEPRLTVLDWYQAGKNHFLLITVSTP